LSSSAMLFGQFQLTTWLKVRQQDEAKILLSMNDPFRFCSAADTPPQNCGWLTTPNISSLLRFCSATRHSATNCGWLTTPNNLNCDRALSPQGVGHYHCHYFVPWVLMNPCKTREPLSISVGGLPPTQLHTPKLVQRWLCSTLAF
jgi:hypothetical protein